MFPYVVVHVFEGVEVNQPPGEKIDPVEEDLCEQIRREKIVYVLLFQTRPKGQSLTFCDQLGESDAQGFPEVDLVLLMSCVSYKSAIGRLKALSTEIEHLQLLLERVKVKIQKDFQKWWTQEASSLQVT